MNKLSGPVADYLPYSEGFLPLAVLLVLTITGEGDGS